MTTLNRFPVLGLWAKAAAIRIGFDYDEAASLGHAYALLYAIRANSRGGPRLANYSKTKVKVSKNPYEAETQDRMNFCGDTLETIEICNRIRGKVGGKNPQTPESYRKAIIQKFPARYYEVLETAFQEFFDQYSPMKVNSKMVYSVYDEFKRDCRAKSRFIDLDLLLEWVRERTK